MVPPPALGLPRPTFIELSPLDGEKNIKTRCVSANDMFVRFFARLYKAEKRESLYLLV